jgi:hypothetical protein
VTIRDDALHAAVLTALRDFVGKEVSASRSVIDAALRDLNDTVGVRSLDVKLDDGTKVAAFTLSEPKVTTALVDDRAFTAYVTEHYPDEMVSSVRPSFTEALLARVEFDDDGHAIDTTTGEIIPGVGTRQGKPTVSLRYADDGRDEIAARWRTGSLPMTLLPALDEGTSDGNA